MVGASLGLAGRYEPYRLICRWLNVKRPGRCAPLGAQGGGYCVWPLCIKADCCGPLQTVRWFRQSDRKPVGLPFRLQRENISILSCIPTKRNQLSTDVRRSPLSFKKGASYGALSFGRLQDAYLYKKKFRFPPAKQEALHSLEPKAC